MEDSPFKAAQVARMLRKHQEIHPRTVCEIGCGAGGILKELLHKLDQGISFAGYEISPQAYGLSRGFENDRLRFVLGDAFEDGITYDLVLVMDVVEHIEDCFHFLRCVARKGKYKLYHIPLDVHLNSLLRGTTATGWDSIGHIHVFTIETALASIACTGQRVIDYMLTEGALRGGSKKRVRTRLANVLRHVLGGISMRLSARLLGGYSILILAE